ncbi:TatD family hydrolase [Pseudomonas eucalypticola]|uniref:TatD family hydrolase n=1 Tax=Pseudomonas eucalypticola TaxID=2599595 RepID=A0A7D5DAJ6_9PSED|nr:TatD family hydrolase [Pseudomonas eucalypticola]QKZ06778.1 TatD family hydrolase [Pseudomonas eucalypticola]
MGLIDTHTHLDFPDFDADRPALLANARALGVQRMVVLGVHQANWQRVWDLVQSDAQLYAAFGLHPVYLDEHQPAHVNELRGWLERLAGHRQVCAVGEFGLDYFLEDLNRERQQALFEAQLTLAAEFELPVLLHVRRSHAAVIATLKRFKLKRAGVIHAFAGSHEEAREYLKLGFKLGLGGAGTWPQAVKLRKTLARLPLEAVVLETDSPDMAPVMYAGQRNSPEHLPMIAEALAEVMGVDAQTLAAASTANACDVFHWPYA